MSVHQIIGNLIYQDSSKERLSKKYNNPDFLKWWMENDEPDFTNWLMSVEGDTTKEGRRRHLLNIDKENIFDYQKAWEHGDRPLLNTEDNLYHWGSKGKGKSHPTYYKQFLPKNLIPIKNEQIRN